MAKYYETLTNLRGDVLANYRAQVVDSNGSAVSIYADASDTPFTDEDGNTVNYATADDEGLVEFHFTPAAGQILQVLTPTGDLVKAIDRFNDALLLSNLVGEVPQSQVTDLVTDLAAKAASADLASTTTGKGAALVKFESGDTVQDLASTDTGKGAALVADEQGGTVQDAIEYEADTTTPATRKLRNKVLEMSISLDDVGCVADAASDGSSGTDNAALIQSIIDYMEAANSGGTILLPKKGLYGVASDIVIRKDGIRLEGRESREGGDLIGLASGTFTDAIVRYGDPATQIAFSGGLRNMRIYSASTSVTPLLVVAANEGCVFDNLLLRSGSAPSLKLWSGGQYTGGATGANPCHKMVLSNCHLTATGGGGGVELIGVNDCILSNSTITTLLGGGLGGIGLSIGADCRSLNLINLYVESFEQPCVINGAGGNLLFDNFGSSCGAAPTAGNAVIEAITALNQIDIRGLFNLATAGFQHDTMLKFANPSLTITTAECVGDLLGRFSLAASQNNGAGATRYTRDYDHELVEVRPVTHTNIVSHTWATLEVDSTTPSVDDRNYYVTANTVSTAITNFLNGTSGQEITVLINDANTTINDNASVQTKAGAPITGPGTIARFVRHGSVWYEV